MSPEVYRKLIKPYHAEIFKQAKSYEMNCFMHSDGRIQPLMDDLIDIGLEVLNPIDTGSGMDLVELKKRYGKKLTFYGGIKARQMHNKERSNMQIDEQIPVAAAGGGYIYHSDHSVPPTVSLSRYKEILERVRNIKINS
jgi:uroporphyrinogen decarboxylase